MSHSSECNMQNLQLYAKNIAKIAQVKIEL